MTAVVEDVKAVEYHGFEACEFFFEGRQAIIVSPANELPGRPWLWRARFWDHWPEVDTRMLHRGYHLVYLDVVDMYGCDAAVGLWERFYDYLTEKRGLARRALLECMSRGGLVAFRWAARHPRQVAGIYADAPVCVISSWPGGKGAGVGSIEDWERCLKAYGLSESEGEAFSQNPRDMAKGLAQAKVPLLLVSGDADPSVPFEENGQLMVQQYRQWQGPVEVLVKLGVGHEHGVSDPELIVEFLENCRQLYISE